MVSYGPCMCHERTVVDREADYRWWAFIGTHLRSPRVTQASLCLALQDVFLMVRRGNQTIFLDATEEVTVLQLKKKLEPIVKRSPEDQQLYNVDTKDPLDDKKTLGDCGYKAGTARAQDPASIGLTFRKSEFLPPKLCGDHI